MALALAAVIVCALAASPALAARPALGASAGPAVRDREGPPADRPRGPADDDGDDDDDAPRPVATRPEGRPAPPGAAGELAVRGLHVPAHVELPTARAEGIGASFVPRPGSLLAEVRLSARTDGGRHVVVRRMVAVHGGRRASVRLRSADLRAGAYEVSVRAGAGRATLGPAVVARVVVG